MTYNDIKNEYFTYLEPKYSNVKSFYKKAKVYSIDNELYLVSYQTIVAKYNMDNNILEIYPDCNSSGEYRLFKENTHSQTTLRHIREFMAQMNIRESYISCIVR